MRTTHTIGARGELRACDELLSVGFHTFRNVSPRGPIGVVAVHEETGETTAPGEVRAGILKVLEMADDEGSDEISFRTVKFQVRKLLGWLQPISDSIWKRARRTVDLEGTGWTRMEKSFRRVEGAS